MKKNDKKIILILTILCIVVFAIIAFVFISAKGNNQINGNDKTVKNMYIYNNDDYGISYYVDSEYNKDADLLDTYNCKSENCQVAISQNKVIVYDDQKVYYKELDNVKQNYKELKKLQTINFNVNKNAVTIENYTFSETESYLVKVGNQLSKTLYVPNAIEQSLYDYPRILFDSKTLQDGIILYDESNNTNQEYIQNLYVYDYLKEKELKNLTNELKYGIERHKIEGIEKQGEFYIINAINNASLEDYIIYNKKFELMFSENNYETFTKCKDFSYNEKIAKNSKSDVIFNNLKYVNGNSLYYIDNNILYLKDENNSIKKKYNDITAIGLRESYLFYLDSSNFVKIMDLSTGKDIISSDIKITKDAYINIGYSEDTFIIAYEDTSLNKTEKWKNIASDYLKSDMNGYCSSINELQSGYLVELDKNGNLLSKKETVIEVSCVTVD